MLSSYGRLPGRIDYHRYFAEQAAGGGPSFPIYRARQAGGLSWGFLTPLLRRHGVPLLKWMGKQAATLATGLGKTYLDQGRLSRDDIKSQLKTQGKQAASAALEKLKQQMGSGRAPFPPLNVNRTNYPHAMAPANPMLFPPTRRKTTRKKAGRRKKARKTSKASGRKVRKTPIKTAYSKFFS